MTVIQVYAPITNVEEAEVDQFTGAQIMSFLLQNSGLNWRK